MTKHDGSQTMTRKYHEMSNPLKITLPKMDFDVARYRAVALLPYTVRLGWSWFGGTVWFRDFSVGEVEYINVPEAS